MEVYYTLLGQQKERVSIAAERAWDNQISVDRGPEFTTVWTRREGGRARADRRASSQTSTATPGT